MATISKEFTLSDGSVWTARQLAFELGITQTACRYRLNKSNDVAVVMRPKYVLNAKAKPHKPYQCKQFLLSDGSKMTAEECAIKWDINKSTMYARLLRGIREIEVLSQKPKSTVNKLSNGYVKMSFQPKAVRNVIQERNYFDPMSRLFLKMA
jgi:DNA-binding Lrp family transcriptional regulator